MPESLVKRILMALGAAVALGLLYLMGTALGTGGLRASPAMPTVVTFDTVKYTNSTRAVASQFLKNESNGESAALLLNLPERVRDSIEKVAGPGTVVMLKQTVVHGAVADITDQVLEDLGLPTNVPTQDPTAFALDQAPTQLTLTLPGQSENTRRGGSTSGRLTLPLVLP